MSAATRATRAARAAEKSRQLATAAPRVNKLALFSETLLVGVCLFVLALPLVTAPAAYAAGAAHLERHLAGRSDTVASLWADFRAALPGSGRYGVGVFVGAVAATINTLLVGSAQLPGGTPVLLATLVLVAGAAVLLLRTAGAWGQPPRDGMVGRERWAQAWAQALTDAVQDWVGSVLLVVALVLSLIFVWMLLPLMFIVPGALVLAVVAVRFRARTS